MQLNFTLLAKLVFRVSPVILFYLLPSLATAQSPDCDIPLRDIVQVQNFRLAYYCAEQQLAEDPENIDAMLVLARAAQELGQAEYADELAKTART